MNSVVSAEVKADVPGVERELQELRSEFPRVVIQVVSMKVLPSAKAVEMLAAQTLRARDTGALLAGKPEVDLLLRLAGTNQITVAIEKTGYKSKGTKMLVAAGPGEDVLELVKRLSKEPRYTLRE
jgi:tRNA threonylcarbamoyladenosine modification (KEOPS) complex Cgi121 subunit